MLEPPRDVPTNRPAVLVAEFACSPRPGGRFLAGKLREHGWGRMWASKLRRHEEYPGEPWGFDNGAWSAFVAGQPFNESLFLRRLDAGLAAGRVPLLAVTPDIVAGGPASLDFSLCWRERLPERWPWFLAVQDGLAGADVLPHLGRFAGLFLGGSDAFKRQAQDWCRLAHAHGLRFHYGRCGKDSSLRHALAVGADSLDSATPVLRVAVGRMRLFRRFEAIWLGQCPERSLFP